MANSEITIDMVTAKTLQLLENNLVLSRMVNRQYDSEFGREGAKIGDTIRIRLPGRSITKKGAALQVGAIDSKYTTLTLTDQAQDALSFTSAERTLSLDDLSNRYLVPRASQLAATIDTDVASLYKRVYWSVGTPGTTPATSAVLLAANQKLNEAAVPIDSRFAVVNPAANAGLVEGMKGLFNPTGTLSAHFKAGRMGEGILGLSEVAMSQSIASHTCGTRAASGEVTVHTTATEGSGTILLTAGGATKTVTEGDVFTVAGCYAVNPQTRQSTGSLMQFVVTANTTISGSSGTSVPIAPAVYSASQVHANVTTLPAASAAVVFMGAASTTYPQNLIFHRDAFTLATADLVLPQGTNEASRRNYHGISLRVISQYDIRTDEFPTRMDILYGYAAIRPEMAVRLWG